MHERSSLEIESLALNKLRILKEEKSSLMSNLLRTIMVDKLPDPVLGNVGERAYVVCKNVYHFYFACHLS